ncbi:MAG: hypothetical protein AAF721_35890, partial [Myxococcota bacterium]
MIKTHMEEIKTAALDNRVEVELEAWHPRPPGFEGVNEKEVASVYFEADFDVVCPRGKSKRRIDVPAALTYTKYRGMWMLESVATNGKIEMACG